MEKQTVYITADIDTSEVDNKINELKQKIEELSALLEKVNSQCDELASPKTSISIYDIEDYLKNEIANHRQPAITPNEL